MARATTDVPGAPNGGDHFQPVEPGGGLDPMVGFNAGHGTRIGATISGHDKAASGRAYYGVAPRVPHLPIRITDSVWINHAQRQFARGLDYAVTHGAGVVNVSLGIFLGTVIPELKRALNRAYDAGVALRFAFPENPKGSYYRVVSEDTEFAFPAGTRAWFHGWAQAPYRLLPLRDWPDQSERPLTLELPNGPKGGLHVALLEAQMVDYARTKFKLSATRPDTLVTAMHDPADLISPFATPWRGIMVARTPGRLVENNDFILNLNEPSRIADPSWIQPGKIMRVMTQTTAAAKANIDFAARHQLQYILFDWKWYGPAFSFSSDATQVAIPDFDLPAIIDYAKARGIVVVPAGYFPRRSGAPSMALEAERELEPTLDEGQESVEVPA